MSASAPPPLPNRSSALPTNSAIQDENLNAFSVSAAKAFFEAAKRPEVQKAAMAAAKNPVIRNAAINAAKNPETRNQMLGLIGESQKPAPPPKKSVENKPAPPPHRPAPKDYASKPVPPPPAQSSSVNSYSSGTSYSAPSAGVSSIVSELQGLKLRKPEDNFSNSCTPSQLKPLRPITVAAPQPVRSTVSPASTLSAAPSRPPPPKPSVSSNANYTSGPHAYVSYQFTSTHFDELSSEIGDLIVLKREVDEQWIYGLNTRTNKHGIIPFNYLDIKVPLTTTSTSSTSYSTPSFSMPQNMAVALYDYSSYDSQDLQFRANDQIKLVEWVNTEWLRGELHGRSGIFPANFVSCPTLHAVPYSASYSAPSNVPLTTMFAAYDYYSGVADDLVFKAGDEVAILEYVGSDWIKGSCNGIVGLAPMTYLTSTPNKKSPTGLAAISSLGHQAKQLATVIEDHETNDPSNLYVSKGDRIIIVETVDEYLYNAKLEEFKSLPAGLIPKRKVVLD